MGADSAEAPTLGCVPATPSQRRRQTAVDVGASLVLAMLAWPFPLARAALSILAHVVALLLFWQLVQIGYYGVTMAVWGQTAGTYLLGLAVRTEAGAGPDRIAAIRWGVLSSLLALSRLLTPASRTRERGLAECTAGVSVVRAD